MKRRTFIPLFYRWFVHELKTETLTNRHNQVVKPLQLLHLPFGCILKRYNLTDNFINREVCMY